MVAKRQDARVFWEWSSWTQIARNSLKLVKVTICSRQHLVDEKIALVVVGGGYQNVTEICISIIANSPYRSAL